MEATKILAFDHSAVNRYTSSDSGRDDGRLQEKEMMAGYKMMPGHPST